VIAPDDHPGALPSDELEDELVDAELQSAYARR
jgi:hypothetical protein